MQFDSMTHERLELPSTAALLENLRKQDDSKGLDILAYLLELQADHKEVSSPTPQVLELANQLYSFAFYSNVQDKSLRQKQSEVVELIGRHGKLRLHKGLIPILLSELIILLRLCLLNSKDEYGAGIIVIYGQVPKDPALALEARNTDMKQSGDGRLDVENETQQIISKGDQQLRSCLESKHTIEEASKSRLTFLNDLLSEQNDDIKDMLTEDPLLRASLIRTSLLFTYVTEQHIVLSSIRVLRRIRNLNTRTTEISNNAQVSMDYILFEHLEALLNSRRPMQVNAAYHLWITLLEKRNQGFDLGSISTQERCWDYILNGLDQGSGEVKKICLHILWTLVQQIPQSLNLRAFKWNAQRYPAQLEFWKTYIAFTEMLALDNSVNQLRLASKELESLIIRAEALEVPSQWIIVLLSQGFKSNSTNDMSVRLSDIVLRFDPKALWWIKEPSSGLISPIEFLKTTLFPHTFKTSNFVVSVLSPTSCDHGNEILRFTKNILTLCFTKGEVLQPLLGVLLDAVIADTRQASAGQFYLMKGILDAFQDQPKSLSNQHADRIVRIAGISTDNLLRADMKAVMCLYLYLNLVNSRNASDLYPHLRNIAQIIRNREHLIDDITLQLMTVELQINRSNILELCQLALQSVVEESVPINEIDIGVCALMAAISSKLNQRPLILELLMNWQGNKSHPSQDVKDTILVHLLRYKIDFRRELQQDAINYHVTNTFREIFNQATQTPHIRDIACLIPLLSANERSGVHQSAMGILQDISENWMAGFNNVENLLSVLRFNLKLCIASAGVPNSGQCPDGLINAIVARTSSFCEEIYEKVKRKRDFYEVILCFLELVEVMIKSRQELPVDLGYYVLTTLHTSILPYTDGIGFSVILDCIEHIFTSCPDALQLVDNLSELLQEWALKAEEDRLGRDQKSNQAKAIAIILHPVVLDASVATGPTLIKICKDIQINMVKRRGLGPALAKALCHAFDVTPSTFCREHGFTEILQEFLVPTGAKVDDNNFAVEDALANLFDEITGSKGTYERYHGEKEKIAQARIFDVLTRFDYDDAIQELWAKTLLDEVFEEWTEIDPNDPASLKIVQKWKKTAQLQTVLLLERFITDDDAEDHLAAIFVALSREASPRYKFLLEWIAFRCILRFPNLSSVIWERFENTEDAIPGYVVSLLRLAHLVSKHLEGGLQREFFTELVTRVLPYATSNKVIIRHEGAELIPQLYEESLQLGYKSLTENALFKSVYEYVLDSPYRKVMVPSATDDFNPVKDFSLVGVLAGNYIMSDEGGEIIPLMFQEDFIAFGADKMKRYVSIGHNPQPFVKINKEKSTTSQQASDVTTGPIQTKGGDWDIRNLLDRQDAIEGRSATRRQSHDLYVIASLVDNNFNLGGISRVCELSGVRELYMSNKATALKSKEFTSVSVSSEHWLPIMELKKQDVTQVLSTKRREGYTIVGIEQTDRSIILGSNDFAFPQKTVLVIGAEKTGIPPELLAEMDICVEVKQFGETRSMNVQTVTAVVLYEYIRQNGGIN